MTQLTNIGQAFPLEGLASDISRNSYNYQSILNGLIEWDTSNDDTVNIRLATDVQPWYQDMQIPTKKSVFSLNGYMSSQKSTVTGGNFSVSSMLSVSTYGGTYGSSTDKGDISLTRVSVKDAGATTWRLYYAPLITELVSGMSVRKGNYFDYSGMIYRAINTVTATTPISSDSGNFSPYFSTWAIAVHYHAGDLVVSDGDLYIVINEVTSSLTKPSDGAGTQYGDYYLLASHYVAGYYSAGSYVLNGNYLYIANTGTSDATTGSSWSKILLLPMTSAGSFTSSCILRWDCDVDSSGYILKNVGAGSTSTTEIYVQNSIRTKEQPSIFQRSTAILATSNYTMYPLDTSTVWSESSPIVSTDDSIHVTTRQPYSASMVFDHTNQELCKTINFVNYDGPDLDQGLCIYLPIEVAVGESGTAVPEDGFTYEFYFRIYPNVKLTSDTVTRDHIVNKAQIYVYSAPDKASITSNSCSSPIAKFSMARMTNFYVFAENIAIPDKPVVYRATFVYSATQNTWLTYDYYQLPDHVFVGPVGFIDPQNPGNCDVNGLNDINPDATHLGYETCAFPTYVDVFSNPDLSPYKSSDGTFYNRSI